MIAMYENALVTDWILATEIKVGLMTANITHIAIATIKMLNEIDDVNLLIIDCI